MRKKLLSLLLPVAILLQFFPILVPKTLAASSYTGYHNLSLAVVNSDNCTAMQAMGVCGPYIYSVKIAEDHSQAILYRTDRKTGATVAVTVDGDRYAKDLYHANDMCTAEVNGATYLFVATLRSGEKGVVCLKVCGSTATTHAVYRLQFNDPMGTEYSASGISTLSVNGNRVKLLLTSGFTSYLATVDLCEGNATLYSTLAFQIESANAYAIVRSVTGSPNATVTVQGVGYAEDTFYVPLTVDHRSVILVYPHISEAIASCNTSLTTSANACIHISNSGYHFFEVESIGVADGIVYFSTNRMRLNNHSMASISFLTDSSSSRLDAMEALRDDGLYRLCSTTDGSYVMVDPNSSDGHLTVAKANGLNAEYFGLECDREGYYSIRSFTSKKYLTVYDDHTVGQEEKRIGDQQWWIVQYLGDGKSALISKYNREYLYYDALSNTITTSETEKPWSLCMYKNTAALEELLFDYKLYTACYGAETAGMTEVQALSHWKNTGKASGYIASVFFDANYYLANNPDVAKAYGAGNYTGAYNHFVNYGFWEGRQGSMFFSLKDYITRKENADIKTAFYPDKAAVLKHFYQYGANESLKHAYRAGSDSFSAMSCVAEYGLQADAGYDFLIDYIKKNVAVSKIATKAELEALLFDAEYYQETTPKLNKNNSALMNMPGETFEEKLYYHWRNYGISEGCVASVYFDAAYYKARHLDSSYTAAEAYTHFVESGFWQGFAGSEFYHGQAYLYGLERQGACSHHSSVTAIRRGSCLENGTATTYCCQCSSVLINTSFSIPHTEILDDAVAATCTEAGLTEGKHCSVCNTVLVEQRIIPAKGHTDISPKDNFCDECDSQILDATIGFRTLSLEGNIAVKYYMSLTEEIAKDENAYMLFTLENGEQIKVPATESVKTLYFGHDYYIFTCALSAKEMTDTILCQFFYGSGQTEEYSYSVKTYADRILTNYSSNEPLCDLIHAMLDYGTASQIHFRHHTERLANAGFEPPDYSSVSIDGFPVNREQGTSLVPFVGASLLLESETTLRIFVRSELPADSFTISYEGKELPVSSSYGLYYVDIENISAKDLDEYVTITVNDGQEVAEISYAPMTYCASVLENAKGIHTPTVQDCVAAMYLYNKAANRYFTE